MDTIEVGFVLCLVEVVESFKETRGNVSEEWDREWQVGEGLNIVLSRQKGYQTII